MKNISTNKAILEVKCRHCSTRVFLQALKSPPVDRFLFSHFGGDRKNGQHEKDFLRSEEKADWRRYQKSEGERQLINLSERSN